VFAALALQALAPGTAAGAEAQRNVIAAPSRTRGATLARIILPTEARTLPGAGHRRWRVRTQTAVSGQQQVLLVLGSATHDGLRWLKVLLPIRPDGSTGWIPGRDVILAHTSWWITVDKRTRTVAVYTRGRRLKMFKAVIGKRSTPTPDGLAAVYEVDRQAQRGGFLGTWALPLTILSHALKRFDGGPGRVALHGRGGLSLRDPLGSARSHGCVRLSDGAVGWLAHRIRRGTPVLIEG
jgi:lipoprotein-anchoring transpeptidase ErfK/SrfK